MPKKKEISWTNHISAASAPPIPLDNLSSKERAEAAARANDAALRAIGYTPAAHHSAARIAKQPTRRYNEKNNSDTTIAK